MAGRQTPLLGCDGHLPTGQLLYLQSATASAGAVAELAATRKVAKYSTLEDQYIFQPIAVESFGPMNWEARKFLAEDFACVWR